MFQRSRNRRGTTTTEFAIVAPVLFLLLLSIMELWNVNFYRNMASEAAYQASRRGIIPGITAEELQEVALRTMQAVGAQGVQVDVDPDVIYDDTVDVTVTVMLPISSNAWIISRLFPDDTIIRRSTCLNRELLNQMIE